LTAIKVLSDQTGEDFAMIEVTKSRAMVLNAPGQLLELVVRELPAPAPHQVLIKVHACGVCRTDLHVVDGDLAEPRLPIVPGHEVVGQAIAVGDAVETVSVGDRVGVPWLGATCGKCDFCRRGEENLCPRALFTGYTLDGGYCDAMLASGQYCFVLKSTLDDAEAAPLLCAGLIGYRSLRKAGDARRIGIYGFGAAAHIVAQVAAHEGRETFAFTRPGDVDAQRFALELGANWAGDSTAPAPEELDAAIIFAPVGSLVPAALRAVRPGGRVVCAGIHMSDIPSFPYDILWHEREIVSVANLTRADGDEFLPLAARIPVKTSIQRYALRDANRALDDLRAGRVHGAAVLTM
jgi:propanol-preferring alcohol dehydrogenase